MTTRAGQLLLMSGLTFHSGRRLADHPELLAAIEAEAAADERERIASEYRKLRGYPATGPGSGDEVLAIIERRGRYWDGVLAPVPQGPQEDQT